jgi:polysaccharide export outer membrane protein
MLAALFAAGLVLLLNVGAQRSWAAEDAPAQRVIPEYHLGASDKIRVITFGEDSLTGEFNIGGSGKVSLPLIGEVQAAGLTISQFQKEVETALKDGYLKDPHVSVEVLTYRPFYILGEVNKPGEYPYSNGLTVMNAVATANGFTYRANDKKVFIRRADSTTEQEYPLTSTLLVAPGDTIRVAERYF